MANTEQNIERSKRFNSLATEDKSFSFVDEYLSPDHRWHDASAPDLPQGPQGAKEFLRQYNEAFSDLKITVIDAFGSGNKVATRWVAEGTNTGSLAGYQPTGKRFRTEGLTIDYYNDEGKLTETWNAWDSHSFYTQLGIMPDAGVEQAKKPGEQRPGVQ